MLLGVTDRIACATSFAGHIGDADGRGVYQHSVALVVHTGAKIIGKYGGLSGLLLESVILFYLGLAPASFKPVLFIERQHENQIDVWILGLQRQHGFRGQGVEAASTASAEGPVAGQDQAFYRFDDSLCNFRCRFSEFPMPGEAGSCLFGTHVLRPPIYSDCLIISLYYYK